MISFVATSLFVGLFILVYLNINTLAKNIIWVNHTNEVLIEIEKLASGMKDAETGQRGYLLTGAERYLEPYNHSSKIVNSTFNRLKELTSDNANQQERLAHIRPLIDAKYAELAETIELRRNSGFESALAVVITDRGKDDMDSLIKYFKEMSNEEKNLMIVRAEKSTNSQQFVTSLLKVGVPIIYVLAFILIFTTSRGVTKRMNQIIRSIVQFAEGDLTQQYLEVNSRDEVGRLADSYNRMKQKISNLIQEITIGDF